jgi:hypothetical protein
MAGMKFPCSLALSFLLAATVAAETIEADIVVFGGTSGGIAAAVQAKRMGKSVVIAEWTNHLGGLTTGGLGATDIGNKGAIGGIAREFYEQIYNHYADEKSWKWQKPVPGVEQSKGKDPLVEKTGRDTKWTFEPSLAMGIFKKWLADAGVTAHLGEKLVSVKKDGARIVEFTTSSGRTYRGKVFIDASYEGDLMAKAGVSYHVGREANATYGETINGVREKTPSHQFTVDVDPYVKPGDPASGLLPFIQPGDGGKPGDGDKCVQAYNFRLCMTRTKDNQVPWSAIKPEGYDEKKFELLARYIEKREAENKPLKVGALMNPTPMPNDKTDTNNNGAFSTDFIGANYAYPDADYATREKIWREHEDYIKGFLYFLSTSERVPQRLRDEMNAWGFAKDEFAATGHFPPQMYVREARRMISDYVMTEADCRWQRKCEDPVGMGAYNMDSHNCQRLAQGGFARNEGDVQVGVAGPYPVSYRSIVPKAEQAENLFVPVCLAATHIAYGSIRMEPVFMIMGQSAATAAVFAIDGKSTVQKVNYAQLQSRLLKDGQILDWTGPARAVAAPRPKLTGIVLDDEDGQKTGEWQHGSLSGTQFIGEGYLHDENEHKGDLKIEWKPQITEPGEYEIFFYFPPNNNRAKQVFVSVAVGGDAKVVTVNQQDKEGRASLGRFKLSAGAPATISLSNANTNGYVVADGVQLVKVNP